MNEKNLPVPAAPRAEEPERVLEGERVERHQPLHPGFYWKAKKAIKVAGWAERKIPKGCVLLLLKIKRVDDKPHTVVLAGHPLIHGEVNFDFLVNEFVRDFDPEPDGPAIRAREMAEVRAEIDALQADLLNFQQDPSALLAAVVKAPALPDKRRQRDADENEQQDPEARFDAAAGLPSTEFRPTTEIAALAARGDVEKLRQQAENQAIIARTRAEIIGAKTTAIAATVKKLTPFYEEQGKVALAQCADALDMYGKLKSGLATLGLYTGSDVEVIVVREGDGAMAEEPIHVFQKLLFMDEESLINVEEGGLNAWDLPQFIEALKTDDGLLRRIAPARRALVAMRYRAEPVDHDKNTNPWVAARIDEQNAKTFLLVKNGDRVAVVLSPMDELERLFPTQGDFDQPFTERGFSGIESERITIEDVRFADAREKLDKLVLHYRRVLILVAGLYDRERDVVGPVSCLGQGSGLGLLSLANQERAFVMVSDEERAIGTDRPSFEDWLREKNRSKQSGSRILAIWDRLINEHSAPAVASRRGEYLHTVADPKAEWEVAIAYREAGEIKVPCAVKRTSWRSEGEFNAAVSLSAYDQHHEEPFGYLCLDDVTPEEVNYYVYTRAGRRRYVKFVPLLIAARKLIEADLAREAIMRGHLLESMHAGNLPTANAVEAISTVIRHWRAAHRGAPVPLRDDPGYEAARTSMLDQLWVLAGQGRDRVVAAEQIAVAENRVPLRLVLTGRKKLVLYATSTPEERVDLLGEHPWVCRIVLDELKTKVSVVSRAQVILPRHDSREEVLKTWDEEPSWVARKKWHALSWEDAAAIVRDLPRLAALGLKWVAPKDAESFDSMLRRAQDDCHKRSKRYVSFGHVFIPLAIARTTKVDRVWDGDKWIPETSYSYYVAGAQVDSPDALWATADKQQRAEVRSWLRSTYANPEHALDGLGKDMRFVYHRIDQLPRLARETFVDSGEWGSKLGSWERDLIQLLEAITKRGYSSEKTTSEIVLRLDAEAGEVYRHLKGKP